MASSDSDYDYTEDDEEEEDDETDYSDDDDEEVEEGDDDSEDDEEEDEDDEEEDDEDEDEDEEEEEEEEEEGVAEEESSNDSDDEDEQVPALEHGEQAEPDEISEGPDAPLSGISTPVDPIPEDQQPALIQTDSKELQMKGNPLPASTDLAPGVDGTITVSSVSTNLEKVKLDYPSSP